jgi:hypothetical protein
MLFKWFMPIIRINCLFALRVNFTVDGSPVSSFGLSAPPLLYRSYFIDLQSVALQRHHHAFLLRDH